MKAESSFQKDRKIMLQEMDCKACMVGMLTLFGLPFYRKKLKGHYTKDVGRYQKMKKK